MPTATEWNGVLDRDVLNRGLVATIDLLVDAARTGDWDAVLRLTSAVPSGLNTWRVGGQSYFTPLHQAAWHGAPVDIVDRLLAEGAWRTLRTADGQMAVDIARARGHGHLLDRLTPTARSMARLAELDEVDRHLGRLIHRRLAEDGIDAGRLRLPQSSVLTEEVDEMLRSPLWVRIPGMVGGFSITLVTAGVRAVSWSHGATGSGQEHVVTRDGTMLVDSGFV